MRPRYRSQEMLQDLFAEINDYLEDNALAPPLARDERPSETFHSVALENDDDEEYGGPVLLESDDEDEEPEQPSPFSFNSPVDSMPEKRTPESLLCPLTEEKAAVCIPYSCNRARRASPMPQNESPPRPRSTSTFTNHNNASRLGGFADRIKQTLVVPPQLDETRHPRNRRSSSSSNTAEESSKQAKPRRRWIPRPRSLPSLTSYVKQQPASRQSMIVTSSSPSPVPGLLPPPVEHRYPSSHVPPLNNNLSFLTPSTRTGQGHVALRMKESRMLSTRDERMAIYTNAYHDCIMAKSNLIPWLTKQYSKGPPDAMFEYTPRERKQSRSLLSFFKRQCIASEKPQKQQHMQPISTFIVSASPAPALPSSTPTPIYSQQHYVPQTETAGSTATLPGLGSDTPSTSSSDLSFRTMSDDIALEHQQRSSVTPQPQQTQRPVSILKKSKSSISLPPAFTTTPREHVYQYRQQQLQLQPHQHHQPPPYRRRSYYRDEVVNDFYDQDDAYDDPDEEEPVNAPALRRRAGYSPPDPNYYDDVESYDDEPPYYYHEPLLGPRRRRHMIIPRPRSAYVEDPRRYYGRPRRVHQC